MSFTSGKISHDPEPWQQPWPGLRRSNVPEKRFGDTAADAWAWNPRAVFDHHNPILVLTRRVWPGPLSDGAEGILGWRDGVSTGPNYTPEHIDHARRVLSKLAALTTTPNGVTD